MLDSGLDLRAVEYVLCDLDGVVWLAHEPLPGAPEAVAALRAAGRRVLFVTNNSFSTIAEQEAALAAVGIPAEGDVINSAQAAAGLVEPGDRVLVGGERGLFEALAARRAEAFDPLDWNAAGRPAVAAVVMGLHRTFDYARLDALSTAVRSGARFVATNSDATYPTPQGLIPGGGSLVAAVATAAGVAPTIAGKPHPPMAAAVAARVGVGFTPDRALMVGDQGNTDGAFAVTLGCPFALVRTGVTPPGASVDGVPVAVDAADLAALVGLLLG
jgi:HAD superfamily hydrolase (TIGR01450 family)